MPLKFREILIEITKKRQEEILESLNTESSNTFKNSESVASSDFIRSKEIS